MTAAASSPEASAPRERSAAHGVRWNLAHLYEAPERTGVDRDLAASLAAANAFAARHRGRVAQLSAPELAAAVDAYEAALEPASRAGAFASLLFAADTQPPRTARCSRTCRSTAPRSATHCASSSSSGSRSKTRARPRCSPSRRSRSAGTSWLPRAAIARTCSPSRRSKSSTRPRTHGERALSRLFDEMVGEPALPRRSSAARRAISARKRCSLCSTTPTARRQAGPPRSPRACARTRACSRSIFNTLVAGQGDRGSPAQLRRRRWTRATSPTRSTPPRCTR